MVPSALRAKKIARVKISHLRTGRSRSVFGRECCELLYGPFKGSDFLLATSQQ
jgi:hypothetical protein